MAAYPRSQHAPAPQWLSILPYWATTNSPALQRRALLLTRVRLALRGLRRWAR